MKNLIVLLFTFHLAFALDEAQQLQLSHPLQNTVQSNKLLCEMQSDIKAYLYETPLSTYTFFNEKSTGLKSQSLITWVHGEIYLETFAASAGLDLRPLLNKEKNTHLGDYRYDIFTILSDLLLQMREESDFSSSKEKAILGTLIDGYFERLKNKDMRCPCIESALHDVRKNDLLRQFTKIINNKRIFISTLENITNVNSLQMVTIKKEVNTHLLKLNLLPIKDLVMDPYGDYLLLSEGASTKLDDDIIFTLSAQTMPVSYQINNKMKKEYLSTSVLNKNKAIASFNKDTYSVIVTIADQEFFLNKLNGNLRLKPKSKETVDYQDYASALGYMLAGFHSNAAHTLSQDFTKKANTQVKQRLLKVELISMVYAYNEVLENRWGSFNQKKISMCN